MKSMLSAVKERRKNTHYFHETYTDLCCLWNVVPISLRKAQADKRILDMCGDKLKLDEWIPIIEALKQDRSLHFIAIHSKYPCKNVLEKVDTETKVHANKQYPALYTKYIMRQLMNSLSTCASESKTLICIELEGLPLQPDYIMILFKGLASNLSLQSLSFHNSPIGDQGCQQLCSLLKKMPSIFSVDLCNCNLSSLAAIEIAETLKFQSLQRFAESWKHSLRYRNPNLELMPGLRRITLNNNPHIGDEGVIYIANVLKEDVWLKAIDLQNCGISNMGALSVLEMLDMNRTLYIVDVRDNSSVDNNFINQIMIKLFHNNVHQDTHEFNWTIPSSQLIVSNVALSHKLRPIKSPTGKWTSVKSVPTHQSLKRNTLTFFHNDNLQHQSDQHVWKVEKPISEKYSSKLEETRQKLKNATDLLEREISLRLQAETKHHDLISRVRELENELQKKHKEKEGFYYIRVEAYETILEALRKFYLLMEYITHGRDASYRSLPVSGSHGSKHGKFCEPLEEINRGCKESLKF